MKRIEEYYLRRAKEGVVLTPAELTVFAKKEKVKVSQKELRKMRSNFEFSAVASKFQKSKDFFSSSVAHYGFCQIDLGVFHPRYKHLNNGCGAFLLAAEMTSQQLFLIPTRDGTSKSWQDAVTKLAETGFNAVRSLCSDRDTAVSVSFRKFILERFGIAWSFMKNRNKVSV